MEGKKAKASSQHRLTMLLEAEADLSEILPLTVTGGFSQLLLVSCQLEPMLCLGWRMTYAFKGLCPHVVANTVILWALVQI